MLEELYIAYVRDSSYTFTLLVGALCIAVYYVNSLFALRNTNQEGLTGQHFLLVTAHPDDECMFFSPTITGLLAAGNRISVLCLSLGDAEGLGSVREKELRKSCKMLGCAETDVHSINHEALKDSMLVTWAPDVIVKQLKQFMKDRQFDAFITFDEHGVSGHPNHTSILPGLRKYVEGLSSTTQPATKSSKKESLATTIAKPVIWKLTSTSLLRKYAGIMDALPTLMMVTWRVFKAPGRDPVKKRQSVLCFMTSPVQSLTGQAAMIRGHPSQMVWFRWFWIVIGRYMYINDLAKVRQ